MEPSITEVIRYTAPTKYDKAPYGTICLVMGEHEICVETHIQVSQSDIDPEWKPMSYLLEKAFHDFIHDKEFIKECLMLYAYNTKRPLLSLVELIKKKERDYTA